MIRPSLNRRRLLSLLPLALLLPAVARAGQKREILGQELDDLLRGKTIQGTWRGRPYEQWFGADGRTSYTQQGQTDWGRWHLGDSGNYCSTWSRGGLSCYRVLEVEGSYYWQSAGGGDLEPFTVEQ